MLLLGGAALVALVALAFAQLADLALEWNRAWVADYGWAAFILIPAAFALLLWATIRLAPNAARSGIPQVIGALSMAPGPAQTRLVRLRPTLWMLPRTVLVLAAGASAGREGPSVRVGAALMLAWGRFWQRLGGPRRGFHANELLAAGAAGGLAAAFNAPLAG